MTNAYVRQNIRTVNTILSVVAILFALYIGITPFLPEIKYRLFTRNQQLPKYGLETANNVSQSESQINYPKENRLVIPSVRIDQQIYEGTDLSVIDNGGVWRKNLWVTSPEERGNTVIVGHRFTYKQPEGALYHLDKIKIGDSISIFWNQKRLNYTVNDVKTVPETEVDIEKDGGVRELTIYTCTPLLTATDRLVVTALPQESILE